MLNFRFVPRPELESSPSDCDFASLSSLGASGVPDLVLRREFYASGDTTGPHFHRDFCALYIIKGGRGAHHIDGIPFSIARGDVYLLPPGALHAYTGYQDLEIDAFYFPLRLWSEDELAALREVSGFWRLFLENEARRLHLRPEAHAPIEDAVAEMRAEAARNERATPFLVRGLLFRLLVHLARNHGSGPDMATPTDETQGGAAPQLAELMAWCEANVGREISVAQLAGRMFLSTAHFARLWKREVGMPPAAYLRRLKLERARALLEDSTHSVRRIAGEAGFENAAHFSRSFRACYGLSPLQFRRESRR